MRKPLAVLLLLLAGAVGALAQTPESRLSLGVTAYQAGDYVSAVTDLEAAAQGFLGNEQMKAYVDTGRFEQLQALETALVYLALAQMRLNREDDARETLMRLHSAERIAPTYATLPLGSDAVEIESLAAALTPEHPLPRNVNVTADEAVALPPIVPKAVERMPVQKTLAEERAERQRLVEEMVERERERIQREADARIAEMKKEADARIAAAEEESRRRVAAAEAQLSERVAAAERAAQERASAAEASSRREYLLSLRTAESAASNGRIDEAVRIYSGVALSAGAPREVLAEAAIGLYRTGAFREAARAFERLGTFARGEEDLRYYYAVALYETGSYAEAQKELLCALPYIEVTDDVSRYRAKIENTVALAARK